MVRWPSKDALGLPGTGSYVKEDSKNNNLRDIKNKIANRRDTDVIDRPGFTGYAVGACRSCRCRVGSFPAKALSPGFAHEAIESEIYCAKIAEAETAAFVRFGSWHQYASRKRIKDDRGRASMRIRFRFHRNTLCFPKACRRTAGRHSDDGNALVAAGPGACTASPSGGRTGGAARISIEPNFGKRGTQ